MLPVFFEFSVKSENNTGPKKLVFTKQNKNGNDLFFLLFRWNLVTHIKYKL